MSKDKGVYVFRRVANGDEIIAWAKEQGFKTTLVPEDLHVTICYSKKAFDVDKAGDHFDSLKFENGERTVEPLGSEGAIVLKFIADELQRRWKQFMDAGATWDYPSYHPHITLTYDADVDIDKIKGYKGAIILGPEVVEEINTDWSSEIVEKLNILKVDDEARMVYGWASVISIGGKPVIDTQGDVIEAEDLVDATTAFMFEQARTSKEMHEGGKIGKVVHSFPLTAEIAKGFGITCDKEGWMVGVKVASDETWQKVKNGELKAFSIGVTALRKEVF